MSNKKRGRWALEVPLKWFLLLHLSLVINSLAGTASKLAGRHEFMSAGFIFWYGVMLAITMAFAVAWQQILKHMSLTFAFTNKPITIIWGLIWGVTIFHEVLTWKMILGSVIILIGILIGVSDTGETSSQKQLTKDAASAAEQERDSAKEVNA